MRYEDFVRLVRANGWTLSVLRSDDAPPSEELLALMSEIGLKKYERFVMRYERENA